MTKIVEFENVYLEYPDIYEKESEEKDYEKEYQEVIFRTQKLSLDELQKRLEETQSLHL